MPLKLTTARAEVLRAISRGEVQRHRGWGKGEKTRDVWAAARKTVTRTCNELTMAEPRLARTGRSTGPSLYSPQVWEITEAGREALAAYDRDQHEDMIRMYDAGQPDHCRKLPRRKQRDA